MPWEARHLAAILALRGVDFLDRGTGEKGFFRGWDSMGLPFGRANRPGLGVCHVDGLLAAAFSTGSFRSGWSASPSDSNRNARMGVRLQLPSKGRCGVVILPTGVLGQMGLSHRDRLEGVWAGGVTYPSGGGVDGRWGPACEVDGLLHGELGNTKPLWLGGMGVGARPGLFAAFDTPLMGVESCFRGVRITFRGVVCERGGRPSGSSPPLVLLPESEYFATTLRCGGACLPVEQGLLRCGFSVWLPSVLVPG
mmetsp:Transcript_130691/g.226075  ORF Transcript_130691/g.226075 Transcript_130691/m.226075 type:complete len:252 (+) Transcript_130691:1636-2391(+)